jgi:hypothetical protein
MKRIFFLPFLLSAGNLFGQTSEPNLYQLAKPFKKTYADVHDNFIVAFDMGKYLDKAGVGSSITKTDTLYLQSDNIYKGKEFNIENVANQLYITSLTEKKTKKYKLDIVQSKKIVYQDLNNAYYLDNYFAMAERLNKKYELNQFSFRNGFYSWKGVRDKEINYLKFRNIVDNLIRKTEDSISKRQDQLVSQTKYLIDNIDKLTYPEFKDSISKIPAEFSYQSSYYKTVVSEISKTNQEYVISLYKDFPENRTLIEFAVEKDKPLLQKLKAIQKSESNLAKKK